MCSPSAYAVFWVHRELRHAARSEPVADSAEAILNKTLMTRPASRLQSFDCYALGVDAPTPNSTVATARRCFIADVLIDT